MWQLLPMLLGGIGKIASGAAQGSANQRVVENNQTGDQNRLLAQMYGINQNATQNSVNAGAAERMNQRGQALDEKKFALAAPSVRAGQSVRGSIMQNAQPVKLSGLPDRISSRIPTIEGGLSPALFNDNTRALGGEMTRKALIDQLKGDEFAPMEATDFSKGIVEQPEMEEYAKQGLLEKILGGVGLAGSVIGGIGEASDAYKKHRAQQEYEPPMGAG
jgi:hypothetical protein